MRVSSDGTCSRYNSDKTVWSIETVTMPIVDDIGDLCGSVKSIMIFLLPT